MAEVSVARENGSRPLSGSRVQNALRTVANDNNALNLNAQNTMFNRLTRPMEREMERRYGANWREAFYGR